MTFNQQQVQFNGEPVAIDSNLTVAAFLQQQAVSGGRFIVVMNDEIVPKSHWSERQIQPDDSIEIMSPISGG